MKERKMETSVTESRKERTEFETGLLAVIHDYVVNYPDEISQISKEVMDQITHDLLSGFTFELTYAKKSALGGHFGEHTIYCDGDTVVRYVKEAESIGTAVELKPNPHTVKEVDITVPLPVRGPAITGGYLDRMLSSWPRKE